MISFSDKGDIIEEDYNISTLNDINRTFNLKGSHFKDKFIDKYYSELEDITNAIDAAKYALARFEEEYIEPKHDDSDERHDEEMLERIDE